MKSEVDSPIGKQILVYAMNSDDDVVLEFSENDNGEKMVLDITEHVEQLERKVNNG